MLLSGSAIPVSGFRLFAWIGGALVVFLLWDTAYTFVQFHRSSIDGDLSNLALPGPGYEGVFEDPLGIGAFTSGNGHGGSNRYFSHLCLKTYYDHVPIWLQHFVEPLESIYLSNALIKLLIHWGMISMLAYYSFLFSGLGKLRTRWFLVIVVALIAALFQTYGNVQVNGHH